MNAMTRNRHASTDSPVFSILQYLFLQESKISSHLLLKSIISTLMYLMPPEASYRVLSSLLKRLSRRSAPAGINCLSTKLP